MSHLWNLISSTVLDYEENFAGDDDDGDDEFGDDAGNATVVQDGDCFEAVVGGANALSTSGKKPGGLHETGDVNTEVAAASGG